MINILALCGSLRQDSITLKAVKIAAEQIRRTDACDILCGNDLNLPLYGSCDKGDIPASVERLRELSLAADGFILASPEYHGNMSGVLKNALDWLDTEHFVGKPSALIAVAGGSQGSHGTLNSLRNTIRCVHGWVLPEQVSIAMSRDVFGPNDRPLNANLEKRLSTLANSLLRAAKALKQMRESEI